MGKLSITYNDFSGGLNADTAPDLLKDNELAITRNAVIDNGPAPKRGGFDKFCGTLKDGETDRYVERMFEWRRNDGTTLIMAVIGNTMSKVTYPGGEVTAVKVLSEPDVGAFVHNDKFYFTGKEGGTDKYWTYDGTTCTEVVAASGADLTNIKKCRDFTWHPASQRIFAAKDRDNPSRLYWSALGAPNDFKGGADFVLPTTGDGPIVALESFNTSLVVFFSSSAWSWTGVEATKDAKWQKVPIGTGCVASRATCMTPDTLAYVDVGGVYALQLAATNYDIVAVTGQQVQKDLSRDKINTVIKGLVHRSTAQAVYDKVHDRLLIGCGDETGNARNNRCLVYQWKQKAWSMWEGLTFDSMLQLADGTLLVGTKNYIVKYVPGLYKDFDVETGEYKAIDYEIETKGFPLMTGASTYADKRLYKVVLAARQFEDQTPSSVNVKVVYDYRGFEYLDIDLMESLIWDDEWDEVWGYTDMLKRELKLRGRGTRVSMNYRNNVIDENVCIYGQAFVFKSKKLKARRQRGGVDIG